ncbi:MAG TPA: hypothetical protein VH044_02415, partial [Polyangiaceae bacterium]|nr:hypothetical protein [Polyangiaceae bacterium]
MSACSQCGTVAKATDRFCNVCGTPLARPSAENVPPAGPQYAPTPPPAPAQAYGAPQQFGGPGGGSVARCQMGHEIAPGASYCAQGHPIALDQMQFSNDAYGGGPPAPQPQAYAPPQPQQGYGVPQRPSPNPYGSPQGQQPYGAPPQQGYPQPGAQQPPQAYQQPGGYAPPPQVAYTPPP